MKSLFCLPFVRQLAPVYFSLVLGMTAQERAPAAEKAAPTPPVAPAADAPAPALPPPEPAAATPEVEKPADAAPSGKKGGLRRIDVPESTEPQSKANGRRNRPRHSSSDEVPFGNHVVARDNVVNEAVSIFGSNTIEGEVRGDAVSVMGSTTIGPEGKVGGGAVAVLGKLDSQGDIRGEAVSVLGGVTINGRVRGEAVSVLGNMTLGPKAVIEGNIVIVGGTLSKDPAAVVQGNEVHVPILGGFEHYEKLTTWLRRCAFLGRPLAFGQNLGWAWGVAFAFLAFYVVLAALFGRGITRCVETLETRPGSSILAAVLTVLLSPVAIVLLIVTVVGALLVPFVGAGLFFAGLFGKAVMLAWIGRRFTRLAGDDRLNHPALAVLIGGLIVMLLYTVWGSYVLYKLLTWLGLGVVVYTISLSMKRETPAVATGGPGRGPGGPASIPPATRRAAASPPTVAAPAAKISPGFSEPPPATTESSAGPAGTGAPAVSTEFAAAAPASVPPPEGVVPPVAPAYLSAGFVAGPPPAALAPPSPTASAPPEMPVAAIAPGVVSSDTLPRAGFFIRLAAMALDALLISLLLGFTSGLMPRFMRMDWFPSGLLLILAIYAAIMWKQKGTTIGGIICGLKVVRLDDRAFDWTTSIVRALSCFLSLFAAGLGFIWVAFDDEKQSWHDKIAGTTVVRVPKGVSLL